MLENLIDLGPDPELIAISDDLKSQEPLKHKAMMATQDEAKYSPFEKYPDGYPLRCTRGKSAITGPLDKTRKEKIAGQRYFKYNVTVMDTEIELDPHFEGHIE